MPRKATILLYADDDFERLAELRRAVAVAERNAIAGDPARLGDDTAGAVREAQEAYNEAVDQAAERAEKWVISAIGHEEWRDLLLAHPPRRVKQGEGDEAKEVDHDDDAALGVNTATFPAAVLAFVDDEDPDVRTIVEPSLTAVDLRKRLKRLSAGEYEHMWLTAYQLNEGGVVDPKSSRFTTVSRRSDET